MNEKPTKETGMSERAGARLTREIGFPRELVFRTLTDQSKGAKVWGPEGAVKLVFEIDPRPGGAIRIHDQDTDGRVAKTSGTILEFVPPELFVFRSTTAIREGIAPFEALQTVRLEELGPNRTRVTIRVQILTLGAFPGGIEALEAGFEGGWGETMDMLERSLKNA